MYAISSRTSYAITPNIYKMKKALGLLLLVFTFQSTIAQDSLTYDFDATPVTTQTEICVDADVPFIYTIKGLNPYIYNVSIKKKRGILETQTPSELNTLFRLDVKKAEEETETAQASTNEVYESENAMEKAVPLTQDQALSKALQELSNECAAFALSSQMIVKLKRMRQTLTTIAQNKYTFSAVQASLEKFGLTNIDYDVLVQYEIDFGVEYGKVFAGYEMAELLAENSNANEELKKLIKNTKEEVKEAYEKIKEEGISKVITEIVELHTNLTDPQKFCVFAAVKPLSNTDFIEFEPVITPKEGLSGWNNPLSNVQVYTKGSWKVDFSVGPLFSFLDGAIDQQFFTDSISSNTLVLRERKSNELGQLNLAAMMHLYKRKCKGPALGFLFGIGAGFKSIDDASLGIYGGGSLVFGKQRKVFLNFGLGLQRVARLKSSFEADGTYATSNFDINNVSENVFRPAAFIGISYTLARVQ